MTITPEQFLRRSPVYRQLQKLGAEFGELAGGACALRYGATATGTDAAAGAIEGTEADRCGELALIDLSLLPRTGYRGPRALPWLEAQQLELPPNNRAAIQPDGGLLVRLGDGEALLLGNLSLGNSQGNSEWLDRLGKEHSRESPGGVYPVLRADSTAWFVVAGKIAPEMLAKLCGVDLSPRVFPQLEVAQTSVARSNAIVLRWDLGETLAYHLFPGAALAEYLWECLMDAMVEYGGRPAGLEAVWSLLAAGQ